MLTKLDDTLWHQLPTTFDHVWTSDPRFFDRYLLTEIAASNFGVIDIDLSQNFDSGFFAGGVFSFASGANLDARFTVKSHRQENLRATVALWTTPGGAITAGDEVLMTAGCDKSPTTCLLKFGNIVNFRGFPHMPGNDRVIAYPSSLAPAMDGGSFFR